MRTATQPLIARIRVSVGLAGSLDARSARLSSSRGVQGISTRGSASSGATRSKRGHRIFSEAETGERKELMFPRLERVAPELALPRVEIPWTPREIESLTEYTSRKQYN